MAKVELSKQDLEIIIDYLPPSYEDSTPRLVSKLKLRLMNVEKALEA